MSGDPKSPPSLPMRHRTHDQLFAAAGVTAALSLIGTGVTVLKGSVLEFSAWPVVGHDQPRRVQLPVAPVVLAPNGGTSSRIAAIAGGSGGTEFPGLAALTGAATPIGTLDFSLPAPVIVPRSGGATSGSAGSTGSTGSSATGTGGIAADELTIQKQGTAGSLGGVDSSTSSGVANSRSGPAAPAGEDTTAAVNGTDTDSDGIPDSWQTSTGTPTTATNAVSDQGVRSRDQTAAFTAEPTDTTPTDTAPVDTPPATEPSPVPDETAPVPTDPAPADPAPAPSDPAPAPDPAPADPAPAADPAPPADP